MCILFWEHGDGGAAAPKIESFRCAYYGASFVWAEMFSTLNAHNISWMEIRAVVTHTELKTLLPRCKTHWLIN